MNKTVAIVLFNLGGPDSLESVEGFLFSLFSDPNIIRLPVFLRIPIAKIISITRTKKAKNIYAKIGGKSPILDETRKQADALSRLLNEQHKEDFKVFICMRHASPRAAEVAAEINEYNPDEIILLPLYPHFSSTTTESSIKDFMDHYRGKTAIKTICCYPVEEQFIDAHVELIRQGMDKLKNRNNFRILFSAHSLPEKIIKLGDPYQWQTEQSVQKIIEKLEIKNLDYFICYQSKVGPVKWLSPSTEDEIIKAAAEKKSLIIVPISFVSEHSETLVELDIDYKNIAEGYGIEYVRIPALGTNKLFINSLANIISRSLGEEIDNKKQCPASFKFCPCLYD
jgi:protoporphyrin/coproporphyrin ferrochelatase